MVTRNGLAAKYDQQYAALHEEFFETINVGTPEQERRRREDKTSEELSARHTQITEDYDAELIANGFEGLNPPPEPPLVFEPPAGTGIPEKVEYIEQYLKELERRT